MLIIYIFKKKATNGTRKSLYFTGDELVMNPVKIWGINGDAELSNINHFNILDFALAQNDNGQTYLSSATSSIMTLKGMDIPGKANASSVNAPNASFDNLIIPDNYLIKDKIRGLNTSLDTLSIDFVDPDGNDVKRFLKVYVVRI